MEHAALPPGERLGSLQKHLSGPSAWDRFEILPCSDGKARRIESKPQPVVDGIPSLLDALRIAGFSENQIEKAAETFPLTESLPGRVGLLRGYGNAIVPQLAAEFVMAWMEAKLKHYE